MLRAAVRIGVLSTIIRNGVLSTIILMASVAEATPYWIAWEGNDYPENEGWERAVLDKPDERYLDNGAMTLDGLNTGGGWDVYKQIRPGTLDPGPDETFIIQFRLRVEDVQVFPRDPSVYLYSDESRAVAMDFGVTTVVLPFEGVYLSIAPGVYHTYELHSSDMRSYSLWIDGDLVRSGQFKATTAASMIGWGDGARFARSRSTWDYFRYGVVPEPAGIGAATMLGVAAVRFRRN